MANKQSPDQPAQRPQEPNKPTSEQEETGGTFKTDVSETDDEGTTVREADVRKDDLTEVDKSNDRGHA